MGSEDIAPDWGWREIVIFFVVIGLFAAALKFGVTAYELNRELRETECKASYWKGQATGKPVNYCPPGCPCGLQ